MNEYIIDLGMSLEFVSINVMLHFYNIVPRCHITIKLTNVNWKLLIENAKRVNLMNIKRNKQIYKDQNSKKLREARTPAGIHLLWICVEDEEIFNPSS